MISDASVLHAGGLPGALAARLSALLIQASETQSGGLCLILSHVDALQTGAPLLKAIAARTGVETVTHANARLFACPLDATAFSQDFFALAAALEQGEQISSHPSVTHFLLAPAAPGQMVEAITATLEQMAITLAADRPEGVLRVGVLGATHARGTLDAASAKLDQMLAAGRLSHIEQGIFKTRVGGLTENTAPGYHELLARFTDVDGATLSAGLVLTGEEPDAPLAALDRAMLDTAFARLQADPALRLTLNVCRTSLVEPRWRTQVETLSSAAPAAAARLTLEITEWPHRAAALPLAEALHGLSALGVSLWLDDFGSGLTSVNEALLPSLSGIKIDRSLIRHSLANGDRLGLVTAISGLARRQGKTCIAEGAENEDERAFAETLGATHVQGFFSGVI